MAGKSSMKLASAFLAGIMFGLGIAISGMANPAKVLNFFDIAGTWDPSLVFVMFSAMLTAMVGYKLVFARSRPVFEAEFVVPKSRIIDMQLIGGSALFGIGWGISGFCPGGAIPALGTGRPEAFVFVAAMLAGIAIAGTLRSTLMSTASA